MALNRIDKDTEITVVNCTHGSFTYAYKDTIIELETFGDEETITFGELKTMASSKHKNVLRNFMLLITEVDSEEVTLKEVIKQLKLERFYEPILKIGDYEDFSSDMFNDFVLDSGTKELENMLKNDNIDAILIECAVNLYKEKELTDYDKLRVIGNALGVSDFNTYFSDVAPK